MNSIKLLQVIDTLNSGGAERVFVDMCNILNKNSINITALFLLEGGLLSQELDYKIPKIELNRNSKWSFTSMKKCSEIISKFDIIHCHFRHVYRYIVLVSKMFSVKSKIVLHDHFGAIEINKKVPFLFTSFLKPKYYIGVSNTLSDWAKQYLQIKSNKVFVLQNIIIKQKVQKNLNLENNLILVSNIKPIKNNIFAIQLAKKCNEKLLIIGKNQDDEYFEKLNAEISNSTISILSNVTNAQIYISNAKLGLHTSFSESGPLVLIEYLAQGLPFLAYETGEVAKTLKPHFPEYFIDNFEIEKWTERIDFLMKQNSNKEKMNVIFEKYFGVEQYFNKLNEIYLCILNN